MRSVSFFLVALAVALSAGCKSTESCEDLCTKTKTCDTNTIECASYCAAATAVSSAGSCDLNGYLSCQTGLAAREDTTCKSQSDALTTCLGTYCAQHGTDANCTTLASAH